MKIIKKAVPIFLLAVFLITAAVPAASAAPKSVNYVALGDSIAAGVILGIPESYPKDGSDKGYPHILASKFESAGFNVDFDDHFCSAGATSAGLALESESFSQNELLRSADFVTLDVGANDLLYEFYSLIERNPGIQQSQDPALIDAFKKELAVVLNGIVANLGTTGKYVQANIEKILKNILTANKDAKIYVMGYYNPLPILKESGTDMTLPVIYFNSFIYRAICNVRRENRGAWISYVDTVAAMSNALDDNYLVAVDIHPTELGHEMIAKLFWQRIKLDRMLSKLM